MKLKKLFLIALLVLASWLPRQGFGQTTATDGDWLASVVILSNTPEAQLMVRVGDIDNLGFGWPTSFDPFSGNDTPGHGFPWAPKPADYSGTDRIMVVSSFNGNPPAGSDGYSGTTRPDNNPRPIVLQYPATGIQIVNAALQIFVDDFQAPVWGAKYQVTLNGKRYPELEVVINSLVQTGPIGKLITVPVSPSLLPEVASGQIALLFDDPTTGAGDGYAIDFVKLLINLKGNLQSGTISGHVSEEGTGRSLAGATVSAFDQTVQTDANGDYRLANVPAGLAFVTASSPGYQTGSTTTDVRAGQTSACSIPSISARTCSISSGCRFSPPEMNMLTLRPVRCRLAWLSRFPVSPVWNHPSPSSGRSSLPPWRYPWKRQAPFTRISPSSAILSSLNGRSVPLLFRAEQTGSGVVAIWEHISVVP